MISDRRHATIHADGMGQTLTCFLSFFVCKTRNLKCQTKNRLVVNVAGLLFSGVLLAGTVFQSTDVE